jgi:hypothetical protein
MIEALSSILDHPLGPFEMEGHPLEAVGPCARSLSPFETTENTLNILSKPNSPSIETSLLVRCPQARVKARTPLLLDDDAVLDKARTRSPGNSSAGTAVRDMLVRMRKSLTPLLEADKDMSQQMVDGVLTTTVSIGGEVEPNNGSGKAAASFGRRKAQVGEIKAKPNVFSLFAARRHGKEQVEDYHSAEGCLLRPEDDNHHHRREGADVRRGAKSVPFGPVGQMNSMSTPLSGEQAEVQFISEDGHDGGAVGDEDECEVLVVEDQFHSISHIRRYSKVAKEALNILERKHKRQDDVGVSEDNRSASRPAFTQQDDSRKAPKCWYSKAGRPAAVKGIFTPFSMNK